MPKNHAPAVGRRRLVWSASKSTTRSFALVVALGLVLGTGVAVPAAAQTAPAPTLAPGDTAWVANTGGQNVLLRDGASYEAGVLEAFPEGTPVGLAVGPIAAADGSLWYQVSVGDRSGYMDTGYLAPAWTTPDAATAPAADLAMPAPAAPSETSSAPALAPASAPSSAAPVPAAPAPSSAPASAPSAPSAPAPIGQAYATTDLNLRDGPSYGDAILTVLPAGTVLTPTGENSGGFIGVAYQGQNGWVDAAYLGTDPNAVLSPPAAPAAAPAAPSSATTAAPPAPSTGPTAPSGTPASANELVNLRGGPGVDAEVLRVLPPGSPVTLTGDESGGYVPVWYNGTEGWIDASFLDFGPAAAAPTSTTTGATTAPTSGTTPSTSGAARSGVATVTEEVNLRADPSLSAPVVGNLPAGTSFEPTGEPVGGFYPVSTSTGLSGWVSGAYLQFFEGIGPPPPTTGQTLPPPDLQSTEPRGAGLIWPVTGGTWYVMQGYNGSSHQNQSDLWQYGNSFDLARGDGQTAGAAVVSPADGTIRWFDASTGGVSIDIGNGHAVALFHVSFDGSLRAGDPVRQGQPLGVVSGPGGPGFAGSPHVQLTLWATDDGGNWDRRAVPFVGAYAIAGLEFPDTGGSNQHRGFEFTV